MNYVSGGEVVLDLTKFTPEMLRFFGVGVITFDTAMNRRMTDTEKKEFFGITNFKEDTFSMLSLKHRYKFKEFLDKETLSRPKDKGAKGLVRIQNLLDFLVPSCFFNFLLFWLQRQNMTKKEGKFSGKTVVSYWEGVLFSDKQILKNGDNNKLLNHVRAVCEKQGASGGKPAFFEWITLLQNDKLKTYFHFKSIKGQRSKSKCKKAPETEKSYLRAKFIEGLMPEKGQDLINKKKKKAIEFQFKGEREWSVDQVCSGAMDEEFSMYQIKAKMQQNVLNTYGSEERNIPAIPTFPSISLKIKKEDFDHFVEELKKFYKNNPRFMDNNYLSESSTTLSLLAKMSPNRYVESNDAQEQKHFHDYARLKRIAKQADVFQDYKKRRRVQKDEENEKLKEKIKSLSSSFTVKEDNGGLIHITLPGVPSLLEHVNLFVYKNNERIPRDLNACSSSSSPRMLNAL